MSLIENVIRVLQYVSPMKNTLLVTAVVTLVAGIVLAIVSRNVWVNKKNFPICSLFYSLGLWNTCRLSACWVRLVMLGWWLVSFQRLEPIHYLVMAFVGLIGCIGRSGIVRIATGGIAVAVEIFGLIAVNLICGYIMDLSAGVFYLMIYMMGAVILFLYGCYIFLSEINDISEERRCLFENQE